MANEEQVKLLKKGVEGWNKWRHENPGKEIDLLHANLMGFDLGGVNFSDVDLRGADLRRTNLEVSLFSGAFLSGANLSGAILLRTNLNKSNLSRANLESVNLSQADISEANLFDAILREANLTEANLENADLNGAELYRTFFNGTSLRNTNLTKTKFGETILGNIDLREVKGINDINHIFPSTIGNDTIQRSNGQISEKFLRGCGLSDWEIESAKLYQPGLSDKVVNDIVYRIYDLRANKAIQINPLFISYSHHDGEFVDEMEKHLNEKGIRFWRDIHDATAGRLEKVVDRAIRQNPIVLLILSKDSVLSDWVEHEARTAREMEKEMGRDVLCPVALDDAWKGCRWPERLREQIMEYNILNFSKWKEKGEFEKVFQKMVEGLDLFYKGK